MSIDLIRKSFIVCGVSNALDNYEDERINVLKPEGIMQSCRDEVPHKLQLLTDRHGYLTNIDVPLAPAEADDDSMDNELAVDDDSDPEDNIPLADL